MAKRCEPADFILARFTPRTEAQREAAELYETATILFLVGPAGTGKTHVPIHLAVRDVLSGRYKKLILTRPAVEAGEHLGFIPGDVAAKLDPFLKPFFRILDDILGRNAKTFIERYVEIAPLAHLRGSTFTNAVVVADEMQNASHKQTLMMLTRVGDGCKLVCTGDPDQADVEDSGLASAADVLAGRQIVVNGVTHRIEVFDFVEADVVRHPLVRAIMKWFGPVVRAKVRRRGGHNC